MKKQTIVSLCLTVALSAAALFAGCVNDGPQGGAIEYPDLPLTSAEGDSWTHTNGEKTELTWFMSTGTLPDSDKFEIGKEIEKKTGCKVKMISIADLSQAEYFLQTLISTGEVPDIITLRDSHTIQKLLVQDGYIYPVSGLAERWAPSLARRLAAKPELTNFLSAADGQIWGIPYGSWADEDAEKFTEKGNMIGTTNFLCVRKDMYEWFTEKYPDVDVSTKAGFKQMLTACTETFGYFKDSDAGTVDGIKKVKNLRGLSLAELDNPFRSGVQVLAQYFGAAYEGEDGVYRDVRTTEAYKEAVLYLNELFRDGLIPEQNMTESLTELSTVMGNRQSVAFIGGAGLNGTTKFRTYGGYNDYYKTVTEGGKTYQLINENRIELVPLIITNDANDEPILTNYEQNGTAYTYVSTTCKRPDLAIKLLDYLWSEEGNTTCVYGMEGVQWEYDTSTPDPFDIKQTAVGWQCRFNFASSEVKAESWTKYGVNSWWQLERESFRYRIQPDYYQAISEMDRDNLRNRLAPISYSFKEFFPISAIAMDYEYASIASNAEQIWAREITSVLQAKNAAECESRLNAVLGMMNGEGFDHLQAYYDTIFQNLKKVYGKEHMWPTYQEDFERKFTQADGTRLMSPTGADYHYPGTSGDLLYSDGQYTTTVERYKELLEEANRYFGIEG